MHPRGLDFERGTAHRRPRKPRDDADAALRLLRPKHRLAEEFLQVVRADLERMRRVAQHLERGLARNATQLLFEVAHASFARVAVDEHPQPCIGDAQLCGRQARLPALLGQQVTFCDRELLLRDVPRQPGDFHAVQERPGNGVELVRGADEQHARQVEAHVEVVIEKARILLRIQHFEQRRGRIALVGIADLVDLVEQDHGVRALRLAQRLDELAGHRTNVRATVALDLGFVTHAADAETIELASQRIGYRTADGRLADAGWTNQQHDRPGNLPGQRAHTQELDDAVLHIGQPFVIAIELLAGLVDVEVIDRVLTPWQRSQGVEVIARACVLRRTGLQHRELLQLFLDPLPGVFGHDAILEAGAKTLSLDGLVILLNPEFLLDFLQLLAQEELALPLADPLLDLLPDFALQSRDFDLALDHQHDFLEAAQQRDGRQHLLQLFPARAGQRRGEVAERRRVVGTEAFEIGPHVLLVKRIVRHQFLDLADNRKRVGTDLLRVLLRRMRVFDLGDEGGTLRQHALDAETLEPFGQELDAAIAAHRMVHAHDGADFGEVLRLRCVVPAARRVDQADHLVRGLADALDGLHPGAFRQYQRHRLRWKEGARWQGEQQELAGQAVFEQCRHPGGVCRVVVFAFHGSP